MRQVDKGTSKAGAELLRQRLHVIGRRRDVRFDCYDPSIAFLHDIAAQKDDRIGRHPCGCGAIEGENGGLAVDLDSNSSRTVAVG